MTLVLQEQARPTRQIIAGQPRPVEATGFSVSVARDRNGGVVVRATLPGLKRDEVDVRLDNSELRISVRRAQEGLESAEIFNRVITLPARQSTGTLQSELIAGVLTIWVPDVRAARARTIRLENS